MAHEHFSEADLEDLFSEARAARPEPPAEALDRVVAQALSGQHRGQSAGGGQGPWSELLQALGGWLGLGGLGAATAFGLVIGFSGLADGPIFGAPDLPEMTLDADGLLADTLTEE